MTDNAKRGDNRTPSPSRGVFRPIRSDRARERAGVRVQLRRALQSTDGLGQTPPTLTLTLSLPNSRGGRGKCSSRTS
jgi:hypothetical protein